MTTTDRPQDGGSGNHCAPSRRTSAEMEAARAMLRSGRTERDDAIEAAALGLAADARNAPDAEPAGPADVIVKRTSRSPERT